MQKVHDVSLIKKSVVDDKSANQNICIVFSDVQKAEPLPNNLRNFFHGNRPLTRNFTQTECLVERNRDGKVVERHDSHQMYWLEPPACKDAQTTAYTLFYDILSKIRKNVNLEKYVTFLDNASFQGKSYLFIEELQSFINHLHLFLSDEILEKRSNKFISVEIIALVKGHTMMACDRGHHRSIISF